MKTLAELKKENEQLKKHIEDLKYVCEIWEKSANDWRTTVRQYQQLLGIRTLRVVR
jgi:cell division protein FtsB